MSTTELIRTISFLKSHQYDMFRDATGKLWIHDVYLDNGETIEAYTRIDSLAQAREWTGY